MKKIILLLSSLLLITSCGAEVAENEKLPESETTVVVSDSAPTEPTTEKKSSETQENIEDVAVTETKDIKKLVNSIDDTMLEDPAFNQTLHHLISTELQTKTAEKAIEKDDVKICDTLTSETEITNCKNNFGLNKAITTKDTSHCESLSENMKSACVSSVTNLKATETKDVNICDTLESDEEKTTCRNRVFFEIATTENDAKKCEFITDELEKEMCKTTLSPVE